jgi:hypothetical protein
MTNKEEWKKRMQDRTAFMLKKEMRILQEHEQFVPEKYMEQASRIISDRNIDRKLGKLFGKVVR